VRFSIGLAFLFAARASGADKGHRGGHEVHCVYWQCISLLYFISLPQDCYKCYGLHLVRVIMNGNSGDFLPLERAEILYSMSFFLLKGILSEQSRLLHQVLDEHMHVCHSGCVSLLNCQFLFIVGLPAAVSLV
jgi:hypothetical protein